MEHVALRPDRLFAQVADAVASYRCIEDGQCQQMRELWVRRCGTPMAVIDENGVGMIPHLVGSGSASLGPFPIVRTAHPYDIGAVDGSQIYPDHHEGVPFFLLHTAAVSFTYGVQPHESHFDWVTDTVVSSVYEGDMWGHWAHQAMVIDSMRTTCELSAGLQLGRRQSPTGILCFDGSLIFWHLRAQPPPEVLTDSRDQFFGQYCAILSSCAIERIVTAWYTSFPRGTDLVHLVRATFPAESERWYKTVVDVDMLYGWLPPAHRTAIFLSGADIAACYPKTIRPAFFYLNTGSEIARVEVPAWIAEQPHECDRIGGILLDQCCKGQGYPIALAEAHEHAVMRDADRQLFFNCARKALGIKGDGNTISRKALNKRRPSF